MADKAIACEFMNNLFMRGKSGLLSSMVPAQAFKSLTQGNLKKLTESATENNRHHLQK